jgi:hypothetical protein
MQSLSGKDYGMLILRMSYVFRLNKVIQLIPAALACQTPATGIGRSQLCRNSKEGKPQLAKHDAG